MGVKVASGLFGIDEDFNLNKNGLERYSKLKLGRCSKTVIVLVFFKTQSLEKRLTTKISSIEILRKNLLTCENCFIDQFSPLSLKIN